MKILLTGARGFIGSFLAKKWQNKFEEMICITRNNVLTDILNNRIICEDLAEGLHVIEPVDVIIHTAAQSPAPGITMEDYIRSNVDAVRNIIKYANRYNVSKIIYLSSMLIYGSVGDSTVDESTPFVNPQYYGLTKYLGEKLIEETERISSIALRLPGVLGPGARTPWLVQTAYKLKKNEVIELYNPNALFNNMIHVSSLEQFVFRLIQTGWSGNELVTVGCVEPMTVFETVNTLKYYLGSNSDIHIIESGKTSFMISVEKALKMGYQPITACETLKLYSKDINSENYL